MLHNKSTASKIFNMKKAKRLCNIFWCLRNIELEKYHIKKWALSNGRLCFCHQEKLHKTSEMKYTFRVLIDKAVHGFRVLFFFSKSEWAMNPLATAYLHMYRIKLTKYLPQNKIYYDCNYYHFCFQNKFSGSIYLWFDDKVNFVG